MNITTSISRHPVRTSVAFTMAAAVLLGASACGTEQAVDQAPATHGKAPAPSGQADVSRDLAECLINQAKAQGASFHCWELTEPGGDGQEGPILGPNGRKVPMPGPNG
jgi:hypothetical protein